MSYTSIIHVFQLLFTRTGESYVHLGLHQAHTQFSHYARDGANNVTILLTDGQSTDPEKTLHHANKLLR